MKASITFDARDIRRFEETCKRLGEKTALKAARKAAQRGSNVVGKAIRRAAPKGQTGQLKRGFKKKAEKSRLKGKYVYEYAMDPAKNDIFQKPIRQPGILGGKNKTAYYPASIEYGFLAKAPGGGFRFVSGKKRPSQKIEGTHFARDAAEAVSGSARSEMHRVLNEELDREWLKR